MFNMETVEEIDLENMVRLVDEIGYPKNLSDVLSDEQIASFHALLVESDFDKAYRIGFREDEALAEKARERILEQDASRAYDRGKSYHDKKLIEMARKKLFEQPWKAYSAFARHKETDLLEKAENLLIEQDALGTYERVITAMEITDDTKRFLGKIGHALIETHPEKAFWAGRRTQNWELQDAVGESLLKIDPEKAYKIAGTGSIKVGLKIAYAILEKNPIAAYETGIRRRDEDLKEKAKQKLLEQDNADDLMYVWRHYDGDQDFLRKAGARILNYPKDALRAGRALKDDELVIKAGYALVEQDPEEAYWVGYKFKDAELMTKARDLFVSKDASKAYEIGKRAKDKGLVEKALAQLSGSTDAGLVKKLYG